MPKPYEYHNFPEYHGDKVRDKLRVGMSVSFGQHGKPKTDAVVVKINRKNIKVRTVQGHKNARPGALWNVDPGLITIQDDADFQPPTEKEIAIIEIHTLLNKHGLTKNDIF